MKFPTPQGATPLDPNETNALIPSDISTQDQLNQAEQSNIVEARAWATGPGQKKILSESFLRKLHYRMFCRVWRWAGRYRTTEKNSGISWASIPEETGKIVSDAGYWIDHQTYSWDEWGARFHHRLVSIHPFSNGNGRHARLMTDVLLIHYGQKAFSWGQKSRDENFRDDVQTRTLYIQSLVKADHHSFSDLIRFVRS